MPLGPQFPTSALAANVCPLHERDESCGVRRAPGAVGDGLGGQLAPDN